MSGHPEAEGSSLQFLRKLALNPLLLVVTMALGVYIGLNHRELSLALAPIGTIYIELLKMVILPFLLSAIMLNVSKLFDTGGVKINYVALLSLFIFTTVLASVVGVFATMALGPGSDVGESGRRVLGEILNKNAFAIDLEIAFDAAPVTKEAGNAAVNAVQNLIPSNIFNALSVGETMKILFFAIVFGISLGKLRIGERRALSDGLVSIYTMCGKIIDNVNLLLPFAFCALIAKQVSDTGTDQLLAMASFVLTFAVICIGVVLVSILVVVVCHRGSPLEAILAMQAPLFVAVATRSSIACLPASIDALARRLSFDRTKVELLLPLGMTLCRHGPILYYASATVFIAQLHGIPITTSVIIGIMVGAWVAGFASAGTTGILTISLLSIVVGPVGLPLDAALVLFIAIDPVIDIFRTAAIVGPNCAMTAMLASRPAARHAHAPAVHHDGTDTMRARDT